MQIHDFAGMTGEQRAELARIIECCEARDEASSWDDLLAAGAADELELVAAAFADGNGLLHASL